mgnify:CR=1 FL=1
MNTFKINKYFVKSIDSETLTFFAKKNREGFKFNYQLLKELKKISTGLTEARFCFHSQPSDLTHVMLIKKTKKRNVGIKMHPKYGKFYFLLVGKVKVTLFNEAGEVYKTHILTQNEPALYLPNKVFHNCLAKTNEAYVLEVTAGPFKKNKSNIFFNQR